MKASRRSASSARWPPTVWRERLHALDDLERLGRRRVDAGPDGGAGVLSDCLDVGVAAVGLGAFGAGALGHPATAFDVVGVAQELGELNLGGNLIGGRVIRQLRRPHAQSVGDRAGFTAEDGAEVVLEDAAGSSVVKVVRSVMRCSSSGRVDRATARSTARCRRSTRIWASSAQACAAATS